MSRLEKTFAPHVSALTPNAKDLAIVLAFVRCVLAYVARPFQTIARVSSEYGPPPGLRFPPRRDAGLLAPVRPGAPGGAAGRRAAQRTPDGYGHPARRPGLRHRRGRRAAR